MWEKKVDNHVKRLSFLEEHVKSLYSLVWGQCTAIMPQKIEASEGYDEMSSNRDGLALLKTIKNVTFQFQSQKYSTQSIYDAKKRFYAN